MPYLRYFLTLLPHLSYKIIIKAANFAKTRLLIYLIKCLFATDVSAFNWEAINERNFNSLVFWRNKKSKLRGVLRRQIFENPSSNKAAAVVSRKSHHKFGFLSTIVSCIIDLERKLLVTMIFSKRKGRIYDCFCIWEVFPDFKQNLDKYQLS